MKILKITSVILAVFIIVITAMFVYNKMEQPVIDENYNQKAIYFFLTNSKLFEQIKDHLLTQKEDIIIYWNGESLLVKDNHYIDIGINSEFKESLIQFVSQSESMIIEYLADSAEIKFELIGVIKPKGIIYIGTSNEKDAENLLNDFNFDTYLKIREHWYYYEQMAGV